MIYLCSADVGDTGAEFDRGFLQELRDLKVFVNDKEIVDEHRRFVWQLCTKFAVAFFFQESCLKSHRVMVYKMDLKQFWLPELKTLLFFSVFEILEQHQFE